MDKKNKYELASIELVYIEAADVIATSAASTSPDYDPNAWA